MGPNFRKLGRIFKSSLDPIYSSHWWPNPVPLPFTIKLLQGVRYFTLPTSSTINHSFTYSMVWLLSQSLHWNNSWRPQNSLHLAKLNDKFTNHLWINLSALLAQLYPENISSLSFNFSWFSSQFGGFSWSDL